MVNSWPGLLDIYCCSLSIPSINNGIPFNFFCLFCSGCLKCFLLSTPEVWGLRWLRHTIDWIAIYIKFQYELITPENDEDQAIVRWPVFIGRKYFPEISLADTADLTHRKNVVVKTYKRKRPMARFLCVSGVKFPLLWKAGSRNNNSWFCLHCSWLSEYINAHQW